MLNNKNYLKHILTMVLLIWSGYTGTGYANFFSNAAVSETDKKSSEGNFSGLISMTTELQNPSILMENKLIDLFDIEAASNCLNYLAKETKKNTRSLNALNNNSKYGYDRLFDLKAQIALKEAVLNELIQSINEAISQAESWRKEWTEEDVHWEHLESLVSKQSSAESLRPTFEKVRQITTRSQDLISLTITPLISQLQAAELIRASQLALELEIEERVTVLNGSLMHKTDRSMFSSKYYALLKRGLLLELPKRLQRISKPDIEFVLQKRGLIIVQVLFFLALSIGIIQRREPLMEMNQWRFIARRPFETGIFFTAITTSFFYGAIPGVWRLIAQGIILILLARLVDAFFESAHKKIKWLVYWLPVYFIVTRLFGVFNLPFSLFRLYIFSTSLIGLPLFLSFSKISVRHKNLPLSPRIFQLGALLFLIILIMEMGGYSTLSAHLLESSLKTTFISLTAWMLMVILRGFLYWIMHSPPLGKIPFVKVKTHFIISRSAFLINILVILLAGAFVLVTWRIYSNPIEAIHAVLTFGITLGARQITVALVLMAGGTLYTSFLISWVVQTILMEDVFSKRQLQVGVRISMARLVHYGFVFIGFLLALMTLGVQFRELSIIAGALGVGIGFGLQGIINNFVSGLILLFERPIKVGDYIELGEQRAEIKKIGLRATVMQTPQRSEIVVPNSDLISNQVTNWTLSDQYVGIRIPVKVAHDSNVPIVTQALLDCAHEHAQVVEYPAPQALFREFGDYSLSFELRGWICEVDDWDLIKSELNHKIQRKFKTLKIQIPFPKQDLNLHLMKSAVFSLMFIVLPSQTICTYFL